MDRKPAPAQSRTEPKARTTSKLPAGTSETGRLFLDVEELSRRSQNAPPSRYIE